MKLIKLMMKLLILIMDIVYWIIVSPVFVPVCLYKLYVNRVWRRNIQIGDKCFFINFMEKRTYGKVEMISPDNKKVGLNMGNAFSWYEIKMLRKI